MFRCVFRSDEAPILIGDPSHFQYGTTIYVHPGIQGIYIGKDLTFGHAGLLHAFKLNYDFYVGTGAYILDCAKV